MKKSLRALRGYNTNRSGQSMPEMPSSETDLLQSLDGCIDCEQFRRLKSGASDSQLYLGDNDGILIERFHLLAVRLKCLRQKRVLKKLLITSSVPEEGKSMVSTSLAAAMAQNGKERIVLVEGDLRRPTIGQRLACRPKAGLTDYLKGDVPAREVVYRVDPHRFYFVPAGSPRDNSVELMESERLAELFDRLTSWFEWIIIDSTPLLPIADTAIWTRLADGILLVTREGKTEKRLLQKALEALNHSALLGVVLNGCSNKLQDKYSKYYRYYRSGALASRNGKQA